MPHTLAVFVSLLILGIINCDVPECNAFGVELQVTDIAGVIKSPEAQLSDAKCVWILQGPDDKFVELNIQNVDLKEQHSCLFEHLQFEYDDSVEPYLRYCGHYVPDKVVLPLSKNPKVIFSSDQWQGSRSRGFSLEYKLLDNKPECGTGLFTCKRPFKCIASEKHCDGRVDCLNGEDEELCAHKPEHPFGCGVSKIEPDLDRIVGGQEAVPGSWPWVVSIQGNYVWPSGHICGGALLNNLYVITAAHCVVGRIFRAFRVKFAEHNQFKVNDGEFYRDLEMYYMHPSYSRFNSTDDVAILKLSAPVPYEQYSDTVTPICLPKPGEVMSEGTGFFITGWGTTETQDGSDELRQVSVPTINVNKCRDMTTRKLPPRTICSGVEEGGKNPCFGDSGGPLMTRQDGKWVLHGVVSWGPKICGMKGEPTVYTQISAHMDWIRKTITT